MKCTFCEREAVAVTNQSTVFAKKIRLICEHHRRWFPFAFVLKSTMGQTLLAKYVRERLCS